MSASEEIKTTGLKRSALGIALMTGISRIMGYIRDQLQARYLGTAHEADAFFIAFLIPNMLRRLVGEGALTAAFIPVYTRWREKRTEHDPWHLARIVLGDLIVILSTLTLIGIVVAPWLIRILAPGFLMIPEKYQLTVLLNRMMWPFILLIGTSALIMAILNSHRVFVWPAAMPIFFNLSIIGMALIFAHRWPRASFAFAGGVILGGAVQVFLQIPALKRIGFPLKPLLNFHHPGVREILRLMIPGLFSLGIAQVNMAVGQIIASILGEGAVASLYYAGRVQELTLGVIAVAYSTVLLPHLSEQAAREDWHAYRYTVTDGVVWIMTWTLPAMTGLMLITQPIVHALFEYGRFDIASRHLTTSALFWFALSVPAYSLVKVFVPAFYAVKNMWTPIFAAAISMGVYITGLSFLAIPMGVGGIALSNSLAAWSQVIYLVIVFSIRRTPLLYGHLLRGLTTLVPPLFVLVGLLHLLSSMWPYPYQGPFLIRMAHIGLWIILSAGVYLGLVLAIRKLIHPHRGD